MLFFCMNSKNMASRSKKKNKQEILDIYMDYVESHGVDISIEDFCSDTHVDKYNFYDYFDSAEHIESSVWEGLMMASIATVTQDELFDSLETRDKLLSLYYTFFENCELNADFLNQSVAGHSRLQLLKVFSSMKSAFTDFILELNIISSCGIGKLEESIGKVTDRMSVEGFYAQLLFLLDFWHNDESVEKEKTDVAIEKAVKATMDLLDITPVRSVFDFGKFMWQERFGKK